MLFPSEIFLFVFLPAVLLLYYVLPRNAKPLKNILLFLASLFFYAWGEPEYVFLMLLVILLSYLSGILIDHLLKSADDRLHAPSLCSKKTAALLVLILTVCMDLGILGWFKYSTFVLNQLNIRLHTNFTLPLLALPIGISFFTFQAMSYVFDIYRKQAKAQKNPLLVGLYISLFPQLIAGPIVRYETIAAQMEHRVETFEDFSAGIARFCIGLGKKVLLANNMALIADNAFKMIFSGRYGASVATAWLGAVSYTLQIFFDFSGYSDMAIGLGLMFGFHFEENFNYPYISATVSEFWRRWHISLQTWFRDYVYFPLGGSRVPLKRLVCNLFIVWLLTGIWHGASFTFIAWGLLYFVLLTFEKLTGLNKKRFWWSHLYTMFFVMLGWVIFRSPTLSDAFIYLKAMFGIGASGLMDSSVLPYLRQNLVYYVAAFICCVPVFPFLEKKFASSRIWQGAYVIGISAIFILSLSFISNNAYSPFIYFNF